MPYLQVFSEQQLRFMVSELAGTFSATGVKSAGRATEGRRGGETLLTTPRLGWGGEALLTTGTTFSSRAGAHFGSFQSAGSSLD